MKNIRNNATIALALGLAMTSVAVNNQEVLASEKIYTVKSGDTLWKIASTNKVTVDEVKKWNNMKDNTVRVGQKLNISAPSSEVVHVVKNGETLWKISTTYGVTTTEIKTWNGMKKDTLYIGQKLTIKKKASTNNSTTGNTSNNTTTKPPVTTEKPKPTEEIKTITHAVKSGETLWKISTTYGVTVAEIRTWNNLKETDALKVNQKLSIKTKVKVEEKEEVTTEKIGVITTDVLNVRKEANTKATIITKVYVGAKFTILEEKNKWYKIKTDKGIGWVSGDYVKATTVTTEKEKEEEKEIKVETYAVTATSLNMRSMNDVAGKIVTTLPYNAKIAVSEIKGNWAYATYGTYKGWVSLDYVKKVAVVNKNKTVMLDAGHGGSDPGAISKIDGTYEKGLVLATTLKLKAALEGAGYTVKMVRSNDASCKQLYATLGKDELNCRVELTKKENPDIFISIHANSVDNTTVNGTETFYSVRNGKATESERLANLVHKHYKIAMSNNDRKVKTANYVVIANTNIPSILLELGFVSNSSDLSKLKNNTVQQNVANKIVLGVDEYFGY